MDIEQGEATPPPPPLEFAALEVDPHDAPCSFCCCCNRVGNLIVICEMPNRPGQKRSLLCVVGPYWQMMLCVTTPLIAGPCIGCILYIFPRVHPGLTAVFALASLLTLGFLWKTATTDPGLVVRHTEKPPAADSQKYRWAWEDRTQTWRVTSARYADDCRVLVDGYDHTCPWTGTAIGAGNIRWFYMFTGALIPLAVFLVVCLIVAVSSQ